MKAIFMALASLAACATMQSGSISALAPLSNKAALTLFATDVPGDGSVAGHVTWSGARPPTPAAHVTTNADACGTSVPFTALEVGTGGGVAGTLVRLTGVRGVKSQLPASVELSQKSCTFRPHVGVLAAGGSLSLANSDTCLHNVHAYKEDQSTLFNLASISGAPVKKTLSDEGIIRVQCDLHPWMLSYVYVADEPFAAVTDLSGAFHFDHVPTGTYTMRVWHEGWTPRPGGGPSSFASPATIDRKIIVPAGGSAMADFTLSGHEQIAVAGQP